MKFDFFYSNRLINMGTHLSKFGGSYYLKTKKCIDSNVLEKGHKFYFVSDYKYPYNPKFMTFTRRIKDIGYVCAWKIDKQLYIFEVELIKDINVVELREPSDIINLHECTGIEFKLDAGLWNNYHTLDAILPDGQNGLAHSGYDGWIEYPTAEPGRPLGIEIAITNPSSVMLTGKSWTLENLLIENADEFECIDLGLVNDLKQGNTNAIEFAKTMIMDVTKILNEFE